MLRPDMVKLDRAEGQEKFSGHQRLIGQETDHERNI
jgi:hypothetical protein